jgi:hypothetical protein
MDKIASRPIQRFKKGDAFVKMSSHPSVYARHGDLEVDVQELLIKQDE